MYRTTVIYKMKNNFKKADAATAQTTAKKMTKKSYIKRADPTMVEMLINGENYDLMKSLSKLLKFPNDEKVIEDADLRLPWVGQIFEMLEQEDDIVFGEDGYPLTVADARETLLEKL